MSELARKASYLKSYRALPLTLHSDLLELKKVFTEEKRDMLSSTGFWTGKVLLQTHAEPVARDVS